VLATFLQALPLTYGLITSCCHVPAPRNTEAAVHGVLTCRWYVPDSAASAPASSAMMLKQVAATAGGVAGCDTTVHSSGDSACDAAAVRMPLRRVWAACDSEAHNCLLRAAA
jgi:hypothetical protein